MYRVLHSVSYLCRAGIETMLMNYYKNLDRSLIQFDFLVNSKKIGDYEEEAVELGARIFQTPGYNPLKIFHYRKFMQELFRSHPEIRIVHGHNGALSYYPIAEAKRAGIKVRIAHSHNTKIEFDLKWILKNYLRHKLKKVATNYFACSKAAAKFYFGSKVAQEKKFVIIRNAIELEKFTFNEKARERIRKQHNWCNKLVVGHVGRFMRQKNHSYLVDVFQNIQKIKFDSVLVLIGNGELEAAIRKKVEIQGLKDYVFFLGSVNNVNEYYHAMDVFVMPSWNEGLPVVGIEAQASGLPCIFSDTITLETKVTQYGYFFSLSNSPMQWATFILQQIGKFQRIDVKQEMSRSGYNIMIEAKRLQDIYLKLIETEYPNG